MNKNNLLKISSLFALLLFCSACTGSSQSGLNRQKVEYSITSDIISRHHPRILFFYTPECGVCQELEPDLTKTLALYEDYFDCQYINANDPTSRKLDTEFHISGVPSTFIFDSQGNQVFEKVGLIEHKTLSNVLKTLYLEGYQDYEIEKKQKAKSTTTSVTAQHKDKASSKTHQQK